jgi:hypothetical protein
MSTNTALLLVKGNSRTLDLYIKKSDGSPFDLAGALITLHVKESTDDLAPDVITKTSASPTEIAVAAPTTAGLAQVYITVPDLAPLDDKQYVYKVIVDPPGSDEFIVIDWSTWEVQSGGITYTPPVFVNTVKIDHNYGSTDALRYLTSGGSPVADAQVRIYYKTDYDLGNTQTPLAITRTKADGRWENVLYVFPGYTYTIQFLKVNSYGPDKVEITV